MNNNIGIYLLRNTATGKVYVGQSTNLEKRKRQFFTSGERCFSKNYKGIVDEIKLYPRNLWTHEVICFCSKDSLDELEKLWIRLYKSTNPEYGYNKAIGGKGSLGTRLSEEHKAKIREINIGKKHSDESKKKMSEALSGEKCYLFGKFSAEHNRSKAINQYTLYGIFVRSWWSLSDVTRELGISHSGISMCCQGKRKSAGGFRWTYADAD
jgi:group I intron endonuclease